MQDGECEHSGSIVRYDNGSRGMAGEDYLRGKIWARRRLVVHYCEGASVLARSHGEEEEASGTTTWASYLQVDQRVVRVWEDDHGCSELRVNGGNGASV